jgi:2'-5' RNA ligase
VAIAVVCAAFDAESDREIAAVRKFIRSLGGRAPHHPAHRPHFTLTAASVDDTSEVIKLAGRVARRHRPFRVKLSAIGSFGRGDVVWLGPIRNSSLTELQRNAYGTLIDAGFPPAFAGQSDPRGWRPHCTIARRLKPDVFREFESSYEPITVTVDAIATVLVGGTGDVGYTAMPGRTRVRH